MIEIIPTLLAPAMLAMSPPNQPVPQHTYDWQAQRTVMSIGGKQISPYSSGSWRGSQSYVGSTLTIDDLNQD